MVLKLYNTLTRKKDVFKPIHGRQVGMYSCGPTVYWYQHIGNLRTALFNDLLKRSLTFLGYNVTHVTNITDVDDKTIKASSKEGIALPLLAKKYEKIYFGNLTSLNILVPTHITRATEHIKDMIGLIDTLLKKKYAYKTSDGIYFSIEKFKNYGKLARLEKVKETHERIKSDEYDKENPQDFALWKFHTEDDGEVFWQAPFGKGRPGWHIECSAMSMHYLGKSFDIHTGANDLIFPHHTNEIAQSEAATGKKFVKYWLHAGFLNMKDGKMSKSKGKIIILNDLTDMNFDPLEYRYLCLTTHYRDPLNFSIENLKAAQNSYQRLKNIIGEFRDDGKENKYYLGEFKKALENDLDMPRALTVLWKLVRDTKAQGKVKTIKKMDEVFGLRLEEKEKIDIPANVLKLVEERDIARQTKNWKMSDILREKIQKLGYIVEDSADGTRVKKGEFYTEAEAKKILDL